MHTCRGHRGTHAKINKSTCGKFTQRTRLHKQFQGRHSTAATTTGTTCCFNYLFYKRVGKSFFVNFGLHHSCFLGFLKNVRALLGCSLPKMSQPQSMIAQLDADCARVSSSSSSCNSSVLVDLHNLQPPHGSSSRNTMKQLVILVSFFPYRQRPRNTITTE